MLTNELINYEKTLNHRNVLFQANDPLTRKVEAESSLQRQAFGGHVMRKNGLESLCLTGKIKGMRRKGRQRLKFLGSTWMDG